MSFERWYYELRVLGKRVILTPLLLATTSWLQPVLLFPTTLILFPSTLIPNSVFQVWLSTRLEIAGTGLVMLAFGWLLRNPEGLLKGASEE